MENLYLYKNMIKKLAGQTVLVAENEKQTIESLRKMLEPTTRLVVADERVDTIRLISESQPNLIMINMDYQSIDQSTTGFELSLAIKQLEAFSLMPHVPVILYANLDSTDTQERFFMSSADFLLIQPINEKNFVENIAKHSFYSHITQA